MFSHIQSSGYEKSRISNKKPQRLWTCLYSLVLLSICVSCHESSVSEKSSTANCNPQFFQEFGKNDSAISFDYFKTDSIVRVNDSLCGYWHQFGLWIDSSLVIIHQGILYQVDKTIFLMPENDSIGYKLFDFGLSIDSHIPISYVLKYPFDFKERKEYAQDKKVYDLVLEDGFYDFSRSDTIYKFRFRDYALLDLSDDLIFWVGKKIGVTGMCMVSKLSNNQKIEIIQSYIGEIYFERIDTIKVETDPSKFRLL